MGLIPDNCRALRYPIQPEPANQSEVRRIHPRFHPRNSPTFGVTGQHERDWSADKVLVDGTIRHQLDGRGPTHNRSAALLRHGGWDRILGPIPARTVSDHLHPMNLRRLNEGKKLVGVVEQFAHDMGGLLISARRAVRVDFHRGCAVGVTESCGHSRYRHAGVEELCRLEVTEVV